MTVRRALRTAAAVTIFGVATWTMPVVAAPATPPTKAGSTHRAVELVVDISGSMNEDDGAGTVKLAGAKQAIISLLDALPANTSVGLRTYPKNGADCGDGELVADAFTDRGVIGRAVRALTADGGTPTGPALTAAADDLTSLGMADGASIVLVSDGQSNCGADPCEVARGIAASGIAVTVNTIGFRISQAGATQLNCIADATGGQYLDAENADELATSLGALAGSALTMEVDAPKTVLRNIGPDQVATSPTVAIRVTIHNTSPNLASDVRAQIKVTSDRRPFILDPIRSLGNLEAADSRQLEWTFAPPIDFTDVDVSFTITISATNAAARSQDVTIGLRGSVSLADAGPLLQGRTHVVILGDSYSAGEGTGTYLDGYDTNTNPCHRSNSTYGAALWASRTILACSGALIPDMTSAQYPGVAVPQIDQLDRLSFAPDLLLMSLGGNDAGFAEIIKACALWSGDCESKHVVSEVACNTSTQLVDAAMATDIATMLYGLNANGLHPCWEDHGAYGDIKLAQAAAIVADLVDAYVRIDASLNNPQRLRDRGGPAPIVVLAYPSPVPDPGRYDEVIKKCPKLLSYNEWKWISTFQATLNAAVASAVAEARAAGVPIYFASQTAHAFEPAHTACDTEKYINYIDASDAAGGASDDVIISGLTWITHGASQRLVRATPAMRKRNEIFHPNIDGYKAMTAGLVQFSNTPAGEQPVVRNRPAALEVRPLPAGPSVHVDALAGRTLERGRTLTVVVPGLQPGATADLSVESTPTIVDSALVADDGTAILTFPIADNFELGRHTLTVSSINADGSLYTYSSTTTVADPTPFWERAGPIVALVGLGIGVLAAAALAIVVDRRRRTAGRPIAQRA
ncbi:MAG: putative von Willebrand factor [Ilumatobacteraceae bacterium]|nr:putative von Willebrand factor [Ilumatobacteraceae bacterium]